MVQKIDLEKLRKAYICRRYSRPCLLDELYLEVGLSGQQGEHFISDLGDGGLSKLVKMVVNIFTAKYYFIEGVLYAWPSSS